MKRKILMLSLLTSLHGNIVIFMPMKSFSFAS